MSVIGDSIVLAVHDDLNLGGIVGRLADWALTQNGLQLRCIGASLVDNHLPGSANPQGNEGMGGYQLAGSSPTGDFVAALDNRVDTIRNPTFVPMFGPAATSIHQPLDFVLECGGANNLNNPGELTATTLAQHLTWLTTLRARLDSRGLTACKIVVMGGYLDINGFHAAVVAANAGIQATVYDAFDAANPGRHLIRLPNWNTRVGDWAGTGGGFNYFDDIHPNGAGYDLIMNGPNGVIAQLGPYILAAANDGTIMGNFSPAAQNAAINHIRNKGAYSPAATHYLHLYSGVGATTPLAGTGNGYAAASNANNTTTYGAAVTGRVRQNAVAFTFPTPTGTWPDVTGWKLTDNSAEGAGLVLASATHSAIPVSASTGPLAYGAATITITIAPVVNSLTGAIHGITDMVAAGILNLFFGAVAYTQLTTTYGSYWTLPPSPYGAGTQAGSRVALTQASVWGVASGAVAASIADVTLTQQATGTYWVEHDAVSAGSVLYVAFRPASVGAGGAILTGQLRTSLQ